ncbi:MAG TPA: hypothetical protein VJ895_01910 [Candidatus Nanoarchaeia archaeon]|nr:hypothetical protein [Candidatus Nanoarchaeia archaeon]
MILEELRIISKKSKGALTKEDSERCQELIENHDDDQELNSWLNSNLHPKIKHFILRRFLKVD